MTLVSLAACLFVCLFVYSAAPIGSFRTLQANENLFHKQSNTAIRCGVGGIDYFRDVPLRESNHLQAGY